MFKLYLITDATCNVKSTLCTVAKQQHERPHEGFYRLETFSPRSEESQSLYITQAWDRPAKTVHASAVLFPENKINKHSETIKGIRQDEPEGGVRQRTGMH